METSNLVGRTVSCECGRTHRIDPREALYGDDAIERMPDLCARHCGGRRACILFDVRTRAAAGAEVGGVLRAAGWQVQEVLLEDRPGGGSPVTDEQTKDALNARMDQPGLIVSVGAGVISDLGKWIAFERDLPAVTFGTAASMNGYAAANISTAVEGVKVVVRARPPAAVASSPAVLRSAPYELTASGLGDVLAKSVSSADWRMNHVLF
ncbi:MAG TPA: iron-containing alcohol dehydrogenase, partial [Phycisphaerae bacterium]|nr:iron-containing alcohol dehydrogenase [Phycisphaerae bacterium]